VAVQAGRIALALALVAGSGLPPPPPAASERSLSELAETYRAVDRDRALAALALWSREDVETGVEALAALLSKLGPGGDARRFAAVALLTESALLDFRARRFHRLRWELQSAAHLMKAAPPATRESVFGRRFYLLAGLTLHSGGELEAGHALLLEGLTVARNDPELLTALASTIETVAALRQYEGSPDAPRRSVRPGYSSESGSVGSLQSASLGEAEGRYKQAVALDPDLGAARLRLGRVRLLQGRPDEALPDLERVARSARQPGTRYLARLFAGRALEALGDLRGAAVAYHDAAAQVPRAQTALVALGRVLDRLGDTSGAQDALDGAGAPGSSEDPWWGYQVGQPERLDDLFEELRGLAP
jgi:tetratricopeptide (TPR) repeat protein